MLSLLFDIRGLLAASERRTGFRSVRFIAVSVARNYMSQDKDNPNSPAAVEPYRHKTLLKANQLIGIKYRSSVLENQLI